MSQPNENTGTHIRELVEEHKLESAIQTLKNPKATQVERDKASDDLVDYHGQVIEMADGFGVDTKFDSFLES